MNINPNNIRFEYYSPIFLLKQKYCKRRKPSEMSCYSCLIKTILIFNFSTAYPRLFQDVHYYDGAFLISMPAGVKI